MVGNLTRKKKATIMGKTEEFNVYVLEQVGTAIGFLPKTQSYVLEKPTRLLIFRKSAIFVTTVPTTLPIGTASQSGVFCLKNSTLVASHKNCSRVFFIKVLCLPE